MTHARRVVLGLLVLAVPSPAPLAQQQQRYFLITSSGTIGTLTVTRAADPWTQTIAWTTTAEAWKLR
jgi:hypothetical protein